jgi:hypothetical protein
MEARAHTSSLYLASRFFRGERESRHVAPAGEALCKELNDHALWRLPRVGHCMHRAAPERSA